jgi:MinD-like ATPase involved in chromosome partitioning or flagellar assembly
VAQAATESLLIDGDPWGGGLDLVLGSETEPGLRWPDLSLAGGRVSLAALRDALPKRHGVSILSGSRGGVTVVCDLARRPSAATEVALAAADLVVLVTPADVRSCAAAAATGHWVAAGNPNTGVVVRGPAPGGLRPVDVARIVGLPVLASMRPQPAIDTGLERGGLRVRPRSPLARAARAVLTLISQNPHPGYQTGVAA